MNSVEKEVGSVCDKREQKNVRSIETTEFVKVLSKMISEYYLNKEEEQE